MALTNGLSQRDGAFWVGSPRSYIQPHNKAGISVSATPNDYALPVNTVDDMHHQPAKRYAPPMGPQRQGPDPEQLRVFHFTGVDAGIPTFFPVGNRSAVTVHSKDGGKPEGLRMLVLSPMKYNRAVLSRHTGKDVRLLPGRSGRPSRRYVPGIPVGS